MGTWNHLLPFLHCDQNARVQTLTGHPRDSSGWCLLVLGGAWETLLERGNGSLVGCQDLSVFAVSALVGGTAQFFAFLRVSEFPTQAWYLLPLTAFAVSDMDAALGNWCWQFRAWAAGTLCQVLFVWAIADTSARSPWEAFPISSLMPPARVAVARFVVSPLESLRDADGRRCIQLIRHAARSPSAHCWAPPRWLPIGR